jgi:hypothetical protein
LALVDERASGETVAATKDDTATAATIDVMSHGIEDHFRSKLRSTNSRLVVAGGGAAAIGTTQAGVVCSSIKESLIDTCISTLFFPDYFLNRFLRNVYLFLLIVSKRYNSRKMRKEMH